MQVRGTTSIDFADENEYVALLYTPLRHVDFKWTTLFGISVRSRAYEEVRLFTLAMVKWMHGHVSLPEFSMCSYKDMLCC